MNSVQSLLKVAADAKHANTKTEEHCHDIPGGRRCAITAVNGLNEGNDPNGWWVGYSPRNGADASVEGSWEDWVALANNILAEDASRGGHVDNTAQVTDGKKD